MNEQAFKELYEEFKSTGYLGTEADFKILMSTNSDAFNDGFNQFTNTGYNGDADAFAQLIGVSNPLKKKIESDFISQNPNVELVTETISSATQPQTEQDYFEGAFGDILRGFDTVTRIGLGDFVDDMARSVATGYYQGQVAEDASDILLRGANATDEDIYSFIEANKEAQKLGPSDEMMAYQKTYEENGKGFMGVVMGLAKSGFQVIPEVILSSVTSMASNKDSRVAAGTILGSGAAVGATTGAAGGTVVLPVIGTVGGAAAGAITGAAATLPYAFAAAGSVLEMGATFSELLQEEIEGELTPEKIREALNDDKIYTSLRNRALARGLTIGVIDAFTGRLGGKVAGGILRKAGKGATKGTKIKSVLAASGVESVGGSVGEATARGVIGQEMDVSEIALEGIAEAPGGIKDVISARFSKPKYKVNGKKVDVETIDNLIETMTLDQLQSTKISIDNDYEGRADKLSDRILQLNTERLILEANPNINPETLAEITKLQLELSSLEGNKTEVAKEKASILKAKIKDLQENQLEAEVDTEVDAFRELEQSEQLKYIEQASKELVEESEAKGDEEFEITEQQNLERAVELFNKDQQTDTEAKIESEGITQFDSTLEEGKKIVEESVADIDEFRSLEQDEQIKFLDQAGKELLEEAESRGETEIEITEAQSLQRAVELFKKDQQQKTEVDDEVVYEMNKTNKRIWSKDFEILDNRQGQEEALFDEEGNKTSDKWWIVNKVTGQIITVGTKAMAKDVIANAPAYAEAFGDGTKVEANMLVTPAPAPAPAPAPKAEVKVEEQVEVETKVEPKTEQEIKARIKELEQVPSGMNAAMQAAKEGKPTNTPEIQAMQEAEISAKEEIESLKEKLKQPKTDPEISRLENEIENDQMSAETILEEITIEQDNYKEEVARIKEEKAKIRKDKKLSKEQKIEAIEEKVAEQEDLKDERDGVIESYREDLKQKKSEIRKAKKALEKITQKPRKQVTKVEKQVDNARKALNKLDKDIKIVIHNDDSSYRKATGEDTREQSTRGEYNPATKTIHINATKVQDNTVAHEVFHALLLRNGITNKQAKAITDRMLKAVKKTASPELLQKLKEHSDNYDSALQSEESIAELFGILASEYKSLDKPTQNLVQRWINKLAKILGVKKFTDAEVIDLLNVVSAKVEAGQEITKQDVAILDKKSNTISKANKRFQADFYDSFSGMTYMYDKNTNEFKQLKKDGYITTDKSIINFNGKYVFFHQPDAAFSGIIAKNGEILVEGKGGMYYPIKFHKDGFFWASTDNAAQKMAEDLNKVSEQNGGTIFMALTSAPYDKLLSSTTMSNAVLDFFTSKMLDKTFAITNNETSSSIKKTLSKVTKSKKVIKETVDKKTGEKIPKKVTTKLEGLALESPIIIEGDYSRVSDKLPSSVNKKIKEGSNKIYVQGDLDATLKNIKEKLGAENSSFNGRKSFSENLINEMAGVIKNKPRAIKQFGKLFSEGIQNKYFKGITKTGKISISKANMIQALSEMFTEPILKDNINREKGGQIYAIIEVNGKLKPVPSDKHESYPKALKSEGGVKINILTDRVNWSDVTEDFKTNKIVSKDRTNKIYPTSGVSVKGLKINTSNISDAQSRKQIENKDVVYSAVFFDTNEVTSKYNQEYPNLYSHHSTIEFKPKDVSGLPIGQNKPIKIVGRLTTDKVDVLLVENDLSNNEFPHITLSTAEGVKPFESNKALKENQDKIVPLNDTITGQVGVFTTEGKEFTGAKSDTPQSRKQKSVLELESNLESKYNVTLDLYQKKDFLELDKIIVTENQRNTGVGSNVMREVIDFANKQGLTIALTPSKSYGATSIDRLKGFYKGLGFVENKGINKDFTTKQSMLKFPDTPQSRKQKPNYKLAKINTPNTTINVVEGAGPDSFEIATKDYKATEGVEGSTIIGFVKNKDFPGEKKKETRGEIFILQVGDKGKGTGTSLMLDALRLMKENGTKTVKFTVPSKEGKPFNESLVRKGYINLLKVSDRTGTSEYEITDKVLEDAPQSRKQKTIQQAARDFNMSETGFFPRNVDSYFLKRAISRAEGDYGVKKARTGSFFLVDGKGRIVKDLFKRPQSRKQIIGENADLTALNISYGLNIAKDIESFLKLTPEQIEKGALKNVPIDIRFLKNKTPEELKYMTGWERGKDNKWRYELPDGELTLRESGTFKLSDVYDSKDLYKAYPQLKDMKVEVDIRPQGAVNAWFIPSDKSIEINAKPDSNVTSLLVHEIQHAIQFIEGFATGGNMLSAFNAYESTVTPEEKRAELELKEEIEVLRNLSGVLEVASIDFEGMSLDEVLDLDFMKENFDALGLEEVGDAVNVYEYVNIDNPQIINKLKTNEFSDSLNLEESFEEASFIAGEKQAEYSDKYSTYGLYQRLAGEVESRNVEKRYGMREEKRRKTLLEATENVAREDQILLFPDAPQSRKQKPSGKKKPSKKPTRKRTSSIKKAITEIKNVLKITPDEQQKIFKALNDQKKRAKDIKKDIVASLRELTKQGKITPSKMVSVINKVPDDFNNPITVERFVEYMTKVFNDADYGNKMMIANAKKGKARKNVSTKIGIAEGLVDQLQRLFSVKPSLIPDSVLDQYMGLINIFGKRESVLSLPPMEEVIQLTENVLQQLDEEQSMAIELADRYENAEKVMGDNGVDYAATIKQMLDNEIITEREYEVMKKYKSQIKPAEPATPKTEAEIEAERQEIIKDVKATKEVDPSVFPSRLERDLAKRFKKLLKTDAINGLSLDDLKNLFKVIDNINNGYLPHYAQIMVGKMNAINDAKVGTNAINRSKLLPLSKIYAKIKSKIGRTGKSPTLELIRRNPTFYIDQVFGDFKTKDIFNSIFKRSAEASAKYTKAIKEVQAKIEKVEQAVFKSLGRNPNKVIMSKYKQMSYLIQQEFLSNPDSNQVNSVEDFLKATIKRIKTETTSYTETDAKMLQEILDKYTANGTKPFDIDQLYESFNVAERNSIRTLEEINKSMTDKAVYTANIIRGNKITPLKNYTHLSVIPDVSKADIIETETSQISDMFNKYLKPSTKAKSLIERTGKVSPLNFDVYASVQRGAKYTLMDFNLTEPIRTARRTLNQIEKNLSDEDGNMSVSNRRKFNAIRDASIESIENLLSNALTQNTIADQAVDYIQKQGYRAILAGIPRASYELLSNILAGIYIDPKGIISGIKNRKLLASPEGKEVMNNLNSTQTNRVFSTGLSGKFVDTGILNQAAGVTASRAKGRVKNTILQLWNKTGQRWIKGVEFTADSLISAPDKLVMQPMWFGAFENRFKQLTGKSPDFDKIAANDEAYMNKYATELNYAKTLADNRSVAMGATDNAFMGILKGTVKPNQGMLLRGFNAFNGFMTRFLIFEYITARTGIMAAVGNGQVNKRQGAALLAGVTTRMIAYTFMGTLVAEAIKDLTEDDDDEDFDFSNFQFEDDDEQGMKSVGKMLGQAMVSAFTSLLLGRDFGNATKSIINLGIEDLNEKYGQFLRDGKYDKYRDAIQYTIIPEGKSGRPPQFADIAPNLFAAYSPMIKTLEFGINKLFESDRVEPDAIERQQDERFIRLPLETFGVLGFIPFYKDIRKIVLADMYKGLRKAKKDAANKKKRKEEMLQGYDSESDMKRYDFPLWERTFGPDSPGYETRQAEKELKRKARKLRQQQKDKMYDYTPPVKKRKKQSSPFGPSSNRKGSSPFGPN